MADAPRARKMAKRISQIVASAIEHEVKDPRLTGVTITDTRVTGDLHEATIYYTVIGAKIDVEPDHQGVAQALESAKGRLRTLVGQGTGVRFTPTLAFVADKVPDVARGIDELLAKARAADAEVAARASGAVHAGEPDPYKAPRVVEDDEDDDDREDDD